MCYVYAVGKTEDLIEPYDKCYIGVTIDLQKRWDFHSKSKYTVGRYIRENALTFEKNMIILHEGSESECFELEEKFRPSPLMGLNESSGGCGGFTSYTPERNQKISKKHKGRKVTWMNKIVKARGSYAGAKNPNSKNWKALSPSGEEYIVEGTLVNFCLEHNLCVSSLRKYRNQVVPDIFKRKGRGGFRPLSPEQLKMRQNTTGWILKEL